MKAISIHFKIRLGYTALETYRILWDLIRLSLRSLELKKEFRTPFDAEKKISVTLFKVLTNILINLLEGINGKKESFDRRSSYN